MTQWFLCCTSLSYNITSVEGMSMQRTDFHYDRSLYKKMIACIKGGVNCWNR
jgi:hypothetical protein